MPDPCCIEDLVEAVRSHPGVVASGAGTKPRLGRVDARFTRVSTARLRGVVEYDPGEFTLTALAGTPVREIAGVLAAQGQYLPFDPLFAGEGASLGGTVAAGTNGAGRFRFGGVRDFILGVRFVDGDGRLLRVGGKVVKNAAGFDLPKFLVGSLGRFGILGEITLKVFPRPPSTLTVRLPVEGIEAAAGLLVTLGSGRWEVDALDLPPAGDAVWVRLAGPEVALGSLARELLGRWPGDGVSPPDAEALWADLRDCRWAHAAGVLVKVPLTTTTLVGLSGALGAIEGGRLHVSGGGNLGLVSVPTTEAAAALGVELERLGLVALTLRGEAPLWLGAFRQAQIARAVKAALDPHSRFPALDD